MTTDVPSPRASVYAVSTDAGGGVFIDAFVRADRGAESELRARGARIGTRAGEWITLRVALDRLPAIVSSPGVRSVELARRAA
jgi:hypothetical protein